MKEHLAISRDVSDVYAQNATAIQSSIKYGIQIVEALQITSTIAGFVVIIGGKRGLIRNDP